MDTKNEITVIIPEIKEVDAKYLKGGILLQLFENFEHNQKSTLNKIYQIDDILFGRHKLTFSEDLIYPVEIKYCGYPLTIV